VSPRYKYLTVWGLKFVSGDETETICSPVPSDEFFYDLLRRYLSILKCKGIEHQLNRKSSHKYLLLLTNKINKP
jgi:hypothetical protein